MASVNYLINNYLSFFFFFLSKGNHLQEEKEHEVDQIHRVKQRKRNPNVQGQDLGHEGPGRNQNQSLQNTSTYANSVIEPTLDGRSQGYVP